MEYCGFCHKNKTIEEMEYICGDVKGVIGIDNKEACKKCTEKLYDDGCDFCKRMFEPYEQMELCSICKNVYCGDCNKFSLGKKCIKCMFEYLRKMDVCDDSSDESSDDSSDESSDESSDDHNKTKCYFCKKSKNYYETETNCQKIIIGKCEIDTCNKCYDKKFDDGCHYCHDIFDEFDTLYRCSICEGIYCSKCDEFSFKKKCVKCFYKYLSKMEVEESDDLEESDESDESDDLEESGKKDPEIQQQV